MLEVGKTIQGNSGEGYDSGFPGCGNFNYKGLDNLYIFVPEVDGLYNVRTCSNYFGTDTQIRFFFYSSYIYSLLIESHSLSLVFIVGLVNPSLVSLEMMIFAAFVHQLTFLLE